MHPFWQSMLEYMAGIDTNLVAKLIGNDVRAQVVEQMFKLDVRPRLPASSGPELVNALQTAFAERDGVMAAQAFERHFDQLRQAMRDALESLQLPYQRKFG